MSIRADRNPDPREYNQSSPVWRFFAQNFRNLYLPCRPKAREAVTEAGISGHLSANADATTKISRRDAVNEGGSNLDSKSIKPPWTRPPFLTRAHVSGSRRR